IGLVEGQSMREPAARAGSGVAISRVMLSDFRSYANLDLPVEGRLVVLTGPNGAGKTNLLEALSTLAPGRGLRGARLSDLSRTTPGDAALRPWSVGATVRSVFGETQLGVGFMPGVDDAGQMKRVVRIDGVPAASPAALVERVRLVWLIPAMDRLFHDGAAERRAEKRGVGEMVGRARTDDVGECDRGCCLAPRGHKTPDDGDERQPDERFPDGAGCASRHRRGDARHDARGRGRGSIRRHV